MTENRPSAAQRLYGSRRPATNPGARPLTDRQRARGHAISRIKEGLALGEEFHFSENDELAAFDDAGTQGAPRLSLAERMRNPKAEERLERGLGMTKAEAIAQRQAEPKLQLGQRDETPVPANRLALSGRGDARGRAFDAVRRYMAGQPVVDEHGQVCGPSPAALAAQERALRAEVEAERLKAASMRAEVEKLQAEVRGDTFAEDEADEWDGFDDE